MKCPKCINCKTDKHIYHGYYCAACGIYAEVSPVSLSRLFGIKVIAGVNKIVPLTKIISRKGRLYYGREKTV